jgi:hypothetical protein
VRKRTEFLYAKGQAIGVKQKKSKKQRDQETLASVTKEMAAPRFVESGRKEEEANHHVRARDPSKKSG